MQIYLNGKITDRAHATISVDDRGFVFGDGVYEVTRVVNGALIDGERHAARLFRNLGQLSIDVPDLDARDVLDISRRLLGENRLQQGEATLYVQVTRGAAPRTHFFPPAGTAPTVLISASPFVNKREQCIAGVRAVTTPDIRWARCDIKTVNLLPNVLAQQSAVTQGAAQAIFARDGVLTETAHANLFGVLDGVLRTYPNSNYILPGITRQAVLEIAHELDMPVLETPLFQADLARVSELFITGTTSDVTPIVEVDGRTIGTGRRGETSRRFYEALMRRMGIVGG